MSMDEVFSEIDEKPSNGLKGSPFSFDEVEGQMGKATSFNMEEFKGVLDDAFKIQQDNKIFFDSEKISQTKNRDQLLKNIAEHVDAVVKKEEAKKGEQQQQLAKAATTLHLQLVVLYKQALEKNKVALQTLLAHGKSPQLVYGNVVQRFADWEAAARRALYFKRIYSLSLNSKKRAVEERVECATVCNQKVFATTTSFLCFVAENVFGWAGIGLEQKQ